MKEKKERSASERAESHLVIFFITSYMKEREGSVSKKAESPLSNYFDVILFFACKIKGEIDLPKDLSFLIFLLSNFEKKI